MSVLLSRKLAHYSCKKIATLCSESELSVPRTDSPMLAANGQGYIQFNVNSVQFLRVGNTFKNRF